MMNRNAFILGTAALASVASMRPVAQSCRAGMFNAIVSKIVENTASDAIEGASRAVSNAINPGHNVIFDLVTAETDVETGAVICVGGILNAGSLLLANSRFEGDVEAHSFSHTGSQCGGLAVASRQAQDRPGRRPQAREASARG